MQPLTTTIVHPWLVIKVAIESALLFYDRHILFFLFFFTSPVITLNNMSYGKNTLIKIKCKITNVTHSRDIMAGLIITTSMDKMTLCHLRWNVMTGLRTSAPATANRQALTFLFSCRHTNKASSVHASDSWNRKIKHAVLTLLLYKAIDITVTINYCNLTSLSVHSLLRAFPSLACRWVRTKDFLPV